MIEPMSRPRPPYLLKQVTRHGRVVWYVRRGKGPRIRIRGEYGTEEFNAEYRAALDGQPRPKRGEPEAATLARLIARYREVDAWQRLSRATRRQRENIFRGVIETAGDERFARITAKTIAAGRDRRASTPAQARHFLDAMRGLFRWAFKAQFVKVDPTVGVDDPARPKTEGFPPWTEEDVAAYEKPWPIGTRQRVLLDVLLYTGLRRGDAAKLGRQHVRNGVSTLTVNDGLKLVENQRYEIDGLSGALRGDL